MEITCKTCKYRWNYKGKSPISVTCPQCHNKSRVLILENLKYADKGVCRECKKQFLKWRKTSTFCSMDCQRRFAGKIGSKVFHERYDQKGPNNPAWKGGISKNHYHYKKIQMERYPERVQCRAILMTAKASGKITPPLTCQHCNQKTKLNAHHEDYSKPLDAVWLCQPCHKKIHGGLHLILNIENKK
jgi:hypothetical protein